MIRLIAIFIILAALYWLGRKWSVPNQRPKMLLIAALLVIAILALTGKLSLVMAACGAAITALIRFWPLISRAEPLIRRFWQKYENQADQSVSIPNGAMTREQAFKVLGLAPGASEQEIIQAHRRLIAKVHPDTGGSDFLAAQINLAKKALLKP